jgi:hypothetical protein
MTLRFLKEAIKHIEAQRLQYEYEEALKEMGSNPEFENRRISRSMVKRRHSLVESKEGRNLEASCILLTGR